MEDKEIVELYFQRSERAVEETKEKYEKYCYRIAYNILHNNEDVEECLNDMYMKTWNAIPPLRPESLGAYVGKIARNLALHVYEKKHRKKRGAGNSEVTLNEIEEMFSRNGNPEEKVEMDFMMSCVDDYLESLTQLNRLVFVGRYWYFESIEEIAAHLGITKSRTKSILFRTRKGLKVYLAKEGILV